MRRAVRSIARIEIEATIANRIAAIVAKLEPPWSTA
jgi:hypothetical protein